MSVNLIEVGAGGELNETGWTPPAEMDFDTWREVGANFQRVEHAVMWWLGDWWAYGEHKYGERASQAVDGEYAFQTLADAGWVSRKFVTSRRREVLSWSHHREVASLDPDTADALLDKAQEENWTIRETRMAARKAKALSSVGPVVTVDGKYDCIVIDPPWDMEKIERDVRPNQVGFDYPTMSESELAEFDVPGFSADDCHLFCWTTHKHLPQALRLLEAWGFVYVCTMVWHKPGGFQPVGLPQYNCEFALYARRGSPSFVETKAFPVCFQAPRREHSRKPDEFYDVVRRVTGGRRIDVFSREARDGFHQYGNETQKFD